MNFILEFLKLLISSYFLYQSGNFVLVHPVYNLIELLWMKPFSAFIYIPHQLKLVPFISTFGTLDFTPGLTAVISLSFFSCQKSLYRFIIMEQPKVRNICNYVEVIGISLAFQLKGHLSKNRPIEKFSLTNKQLPHISLKWEFYLCEWFSTYYNFERLDIVCKGKSW